MRIKVNLNRDHSNELHVSDLILAFNVNKNKLVSLLSDLIVRISFTIRTILHTYQASCYLFLRCGTEIYHERVISNKDATVALCSHVY